MNNKLKSMFLMGSVIALSSVVLSGNASGTDLNNSAIININNTQQIKVNNLTNGKTDYILSAADITLNDGDEVTRDTNYDGSLLINIYRDYTVNVIDGENKVPLSYTRSQSVADILADSGIPELSDIDVLSIGKNESVDNDTDIVVTRMQPLTVEADGQTRKINVPVKDIASEALKKAGYSIGENDEVNYDLTKQFPYDFDLKISRVEYKDVVNEENIDFDTQTVDDDSLYTGEEDVTTEGQNGTRQITTKQKIVDGQNVSEETVSDIVTVQPVTKIISKGTKERPQVIQSAVTSQQTDSSSISGFSYSKLYTGRCSAYTGGGITATGAAAAVGRVAVDPSIIPFGTKLYVTAADGSYTYGYCIASDTGGFVYNGSGVMLDLYMNTESDCINFGSRVMNIYVLD